MSAGAFKLQSRGRSAVATWSRGYRGRYVTRQDWPRVAELACYVAAPLLGVGLALLFCA